MSFLGYHVEALGEYCECCLMPEFPVHLSKNWKMYVCASCDGHCKLCDEGRRR